MANRSRQAKQVVFSGAEAQPIEIVDPQRNRRWQAALKPIHQPVVRFFRITCLGISFFNLWARR
jgi:hypothetical protein